MEKIRILIVEDNELVSEALKILLETRKEYIVIGEARNGLDAINVCELREVDLVLMDITMPVLNGIEATRIIRSKEIAPRVIGLSMHSEIEYAEEILTAGANGYIDKNTSFEELCTAINSVTRGARFIGDNLCEKYIRRKNERTKLR